MGVAVFRKALVLVGALSLQPPISVHAQDYSNSPTQRDSEDRAPNQYVAEPVELVPSRLPIFIQFQPLIPTEQFEADEGKPKEPNAGGEQKTWYDRFILDHITDWLLVLFNGILALYTIKLFGSAREQSRDTKVALALTRVSADAAERSAKVAERALTDTERPYVFVDGVDKFKLLDPGNENSAVYVDYKVSNFGRLPAIITRIRVECVIIDRGQFFMPNDARNDHPLITSPIVASGSIVGPVKIYSSDITFAADERGDINESEFLAELEYDMPVDQYGTPWVRPTIPSNKELRFRVVVDYRGPFTWDHNTSACWRYDRNTFRFVSSGPEVNYEA